MIKRYQFVIWPKMEDAPYANTGSIGILLSV